MVKPHQGEERRQNSFAEVWQRLAEAGGAELTTSAGTAFSARATITTRGPRKGQRVVRYFQQGKEYARCYECCWDHYYNCHGTRVGMYSKAVDEWAGLTGGVARPTVDALLTLIERNGGPRGLDLSGKDLSRLDLGPDGVRKALNLRGFRGTERFPAWVYAPNQRPRGIRLDGVILEETNLCDTDLRGAFLADGNLRRARLEGANLENADLEGADLQGAYLWQANLRGACLYEANLQEASLWDADLRGAEVSGTDLRGAELWDANLAELDLNRALALDGIHLFRARLVRTNLRKQQLGPGIGEEKDSEYHYAKEAYLRLKSNFESIGRYGDASWAYVKERKMEKMTHDPRFARRYYAELEGLAHDAGWRTPSWWWFGVRHTVKWVSDWLVEAVCGYGESIVRVLGTLLFLWFGAAIYYRVVWGMIGADGASVTSFGDYLAYSLGALTTTGYDHLRPRLDMGWIPVITAVEALFGIFLTGLLGFVAANRIRRS